MEIIIKAFSIDVYAELTTIPSFTADNLKIEDGKLYCPLATLLTKEYGDQYGNLDSVRVKDEYTLVFTMKDTVITMSQIKKLEDFGTIYSVFVEHQYDEYSESSYPVLSVTVRRDNYEEQIKEEYDSMQEFLAHENEYKMELELLEEQKAGMKRQRRYRK